MAYKYRRRGSYKGGYHRSQRRKRESQGAPLSEAFWRLGVMGAKTAWKATTMGMRVAHRGRRLFRR